jgi:formylglycine-generating enzyme required for sulfatase activity
MADKTGAFSYVAVFTAKDPVIIGTYEVCAFPGDNIVGCCTHADCFCPPTWGCPLAPGEELVMQASCSLLNPSENGYVRAYVYLCSGERFQVTTTVVPWSPVEVVPVGNPGNANDTYGDGYGSVDYVYNIGKFEVTAGEYVDFLNAVAATDTYGLYNPHMDSSSYSCQITQNGTSGSYSYDFSGGTVEVPGSTAADWENRPVNYVSWGDAARFANWMHNGQPTGAQELGTTEDGSYFLDGATGWMDLVAVVREPDATWVIPSEDEWYKAAYYDGDTGLYYDYPTGADDPNVPSNDLIDPDPGNNATFRISPDDYTIGSPYWRTEVGEFENSESPYGTFDQGGNVWEWNEAIHLGVFRMVRGGALNTYDFSMQPGYRLHKDPTNEIGNIGFRVAEVPVLDFNGDGNVDLHDFALLQADFGGDLDLHYFAWFQENFTGPLP